MKSLSNGGITRRTACGTTTWRIVCEYVNPERTRRGGLAPVHRLDARAVHLGHICAIRQAERNDRVLDVGEVADDGHVRLRETETDDVDHQQRRDTAEHIDVHRCQETDRSAGWARQQPHHRNYQCPDQDDDLGDHEDLDVDPEALQQRLPSGLVSQGRPSEEDPCNSLIVCSEQPGEKPQRVHRQADADRVPRPVAGTFALVARRFDLAFACASRAARIEWTIAGTPAGGNSSAMLDAFR